MNETNINEAGLPQVAVCPVCQGRGHVAVGFYSTSNIPLSSTATTTEMCHSCWGAGYVWRQQARP